VSIAIRRGRPRPQLEVLERRTLLNGAGDPDPSFGGGYGYANLPLGFSALLTNYSEPEIPWKTVVAEPDGKIVASGVIEGFHAGSNELAVGRFDTDGTPDDTFGVGGLVRLPLLPGEYDYLSTVVQADGKIVEVSDFTPGDSPDYPTYVAMRLDADGTLDTSYGIDGLAEYPASTTTPVVDRLARVGAAVLQGDGKIVLLGSSYEISGSSARYAAVRLNADGTPDSSYGQGGTSIVPVSAGYIPDDTTLAAAIQADGKVVLAGYVTTGSGSIGSDDTDLAVIRLDSDGSLDWTFDGGSVLLPSHPHTQGYDPSMAVVVQPADGKVVVSRSDPSSAGEPPAATTLYRFEPDGDLDPTFGVGGQVTPDFSGFHPIIIAHALPSNGDLAIEPDGKIVLAESYGNRDLLVGRLDADGTADPTFANDTTTGLFQPRLQALGGSVSLAIQPTDGKVLLLGGGTSSSPVGLVGAFTLARLLPDASSGLEPLAPLPIPPSDLDPGVTGVDFLLGPYTNARDGVTSPAIYDPSSGRFFYRGEVSDALPSFLRFGLTGVGQTIPALADYDGVGYDQAAAYIPSLGLYEIGSTDGTPNRFLPFGIPGAGQTIPAPADYEGTGEDDVAIYMPSIASFAIIPSDGSSAKLVPFGIAGAGQSIPAPADYFGTGRADVAVYLPSLAAFAIQPPGGGPTVIVPFGTPGLGVTIPVPGDYDGSGHVELAVYIPAFGKFIYRPYGGGVPDVVVPFGTPGVGELPAVGDYDGSGRTEVAVYDPSRGFLAYRPAFGGPDVFSYYGSPDDGSIPAATPSGALPEFAGTSTGSTFSAVGSSTTPTGPAAPTMSPAVAATQSRAVPVSPMLASIRVARSLVNQGSDDPSKLTA
jgi:uncharacterized delta-60 repeat protein